MAETKFNICASVVDSVLMVTADGQYPPCCVISTQPIRYTLVLDLSNCAQDGQRRTCLGTPTPCSVIVWELMSWAEPGLMERQSVNPTTVDMNYGCTSGDTLNDQRDGGSALAPASPSQSE